MLDVNVFIAQMTMLETIYKFQVITLPSTTPAEKEFKNAMRELWYGDFKNIPTEIFIEGCRQLRRSHKYHSVIPSNIIDYCTDIMKQLVNDQDQAWNEVLKSFIHYHPEFSIDEAMGSYTPKVREIVEKLGGFREMSKKDGKDVRFMELEFKKMYTETITMAIDRKINTGQNTLEFKDVKMLGCD